MKFEKYTRWLELRGEVLEEEKARENMQGHRYIPIDDK